MTMAARRPDGAAALRGPDGGVAPDRLADPVPLPGRRRGRWWVPSAVALLLVAWVAGVMIGPAGPPWYRVPLELLDALPLIDIDTGVSRVEHNTLWQIRMPRVVLAGLVGASLSVSGAAYQGVFRNPLVDPYLLGVAAGAGLGATIVLTVGRAETLGWPVDPLVVAAFAGGLAAVALTYAAGAAFGAAKSPATLVLAGVAVVSLATAIQTFILQRNSEVIRKVYSWILGSLSTATWRDVRLALPYTIVAIIVLLAHRRLLDVLRVGDDEAAALGARVGRIRITVVIAATIATAAVVAVSGLIGFVGIMVPHAARMLGGASYRRVLPLSLFGGAAFLILADIPGRMLTRPAELPIGVVTAFFGAPFFILVLRTRGRP